MEMKDENEMKMIKEKNMNKLEEIKKRRTEMTNHLLKGGGRQEQKTMQDKTNRVTQSQMPKVDMNTEKRRLHSITLRDKEWEEESVRRKKGKPGNG